MKKYMKGKHLSTLAEFYQGKCEDSIFQQVYINRSKTI